MELTIIFDIDGVIVDSEQLHFDVLRKLAPDYTSGVQPQQLIGLSLEETLNYIGVPVSLRADISARSMEAYRHGLDPAYLRPGVAALVNALETKGIPFGFVSTAPRDVCLANLSLLDMAAPVKLISGDDVPRTKPHPDPYLAMLRILEARADRTVVLEDTDIGIQAARAAGIEKVYGWPHVLSGTQTYTLAAAVIAGLDDIPELGFLDLRADTGLD